VTGQGSLQLLFYLVVLIALAKPLGAFMARVYEGRPCGLDAVLGWLERLIYLLVYVLQRLQAGLPLNPQGFGAVSADSSFNTAASFATNTNWQGYGGESTMSYLTQMLGLTVQNFVSAATGMAVLVALIRGFARRSAQTIGNFWVDLTRTTLYILLPLAVIFALLLASQGVVQTFSPYAKASVVQPTQYDEPITDKDGKPVLDDKGQPKTKKATLTEQVIAVGPPRRSPSSSSAPTGAASSTQTPLIPSRIPRRSPTSSRCWPSCSFRPLSATPSASWCATPGRVGSSWPP